MLQDVECLRGKVKDARSRDSGNTILMKEFLGGMMVFTGANSGVGLRFMSAQNLMEDEVDASLHSGPHGAGGFIALP